MFTRPVVSTQQTQTKAVQKQPAQLWIHRFSAKTLADFQPRNHLLAELQRFDCYNSPNILIHGPEHGGKKLLARLLVRNIWKDNHTHLSKNVVEIQAREWAEQSLDTVKSQIHTLQKWISPQELFSFSSEDEDRSFATYGTQKRLKFIVLLDLHLLSLPVQRLIIRLANTQCASRTRLICTTKSMPVLHKWFCSSSQIVYTSCPRRQHATSLIDKGLASQKNKGASLMHVQDTNHSDFCDFAYTVTCAQVEASGTKAQLLDRNGRMKEIIRKFTKPWLRHYSDNLAKEELNKVEQKSQYGLQMKLKMPILPVLSDKDASEMEHYIGVLLGTGSLKQIISTTLEVLRIYQDPNKQAPLVSAPAPDTSDTSHKQATLHVGLLRDSTLFKLCRDAAELEHTCKTIVPASYTVQHLYTEQFFSLVRATLLTPACLLTKN